MSSQTHTHALIVDTPSWYNLFKVLNYIEYADWHRVKIIAILSTIYTISAWVCVSFWNYWKTSAQMIGNIMLTSTQTIQFLWLNHLHNKSLKTQIKGTHQLKVSWVNESIYFACAFVCANPKFMQLTYVLNDRSGCLSLFWFLFSIFCFLFSEYTLNSKF